ncbi:hypothetical protein [Emticicia sp. C21]|uniref:hypothetical protein n=1 Tax=Emticicia sp. C21 TaxID=2302915 RepID=UPI000E34FB70|nr:hypothetical protein [Emticicia sp. C21]RFS15041.1 hypothetical protein D0T08_18355 [Emticicia sp. C21]
MKRTFIYIALFIFILNSQGFAQKFGIIAGALASKTYYRLSFIQSLSIPFELGYVAELTFNASVIGKLPLETILMLVHKPEIAYDTEKQGIARRLFLSGLAGLSFFLTKNLSLTIDYQTNINNPGRSSNDKVRGHTFL